MKSTDGSCRSPSRGPALLVDFDDTAAVQNVAELLLSRFGHPDWQQVRRRFRAGELTLKEYQEITFRGVQADRAAMQSYVREHASLRPHFKELWQYCQADHIPMAIVSLGLDFYIRALLASQGIRSLPVYAVATRFTARGITYRYPYTQPGQEHLGNSKGLIVDRYRGEGYRVVYVGDGRSDFCPASRADLVFAHGVLAQECQRQGVPFRPFCDFGDVLLALRGFGRDGPLPAAS